MSRLAWFPGCRCSDFTLLDLFRLSHGGHPDDDGDCHGDGDGGGDDDDDDADADGDLWIITPRRPTQMWNKLRCVDYFPKDMAFSHVFACLRQGIPSNQIKVPYDSIESIQLKVGWWPQLISSLFIYHKP